ncbi:unnamed protein product, partial [Scytosiphon promiscuus]
SLKWGSGEGPLMHATESGHLPVAVSLLAADADVNITSATDGRTAIEFAATQGHDGMVGALLAGGADKDKLDSGGATSLMWAVAGGHLPVVETLLAAGADANIFGPGEDSPLHSAASVGCGEIVDALLSGGANKNALNNGGLTPLMEASKGECMRTYSPIVESLLAAGADVNISGVVDGHTALHLAAERGSDRIVNALLAAGADKDALDNGGATPLIWAADRCHLTVVNTLLEADADVNISGADEGHTALHVAASRGWGEIVDALLAGGADKEALDNRGYTPLIWVAEQGHLPVTEALLYAGADVNISGGDDGSTALHWASREGHGGIRDALLACGAHRDVLDTRGLTPLMEAAARDHLQVVGALLVAGADETVEDEHHETASDKTACDSVRQLLARAPVDRANRAWHRRGWLVMLRARAERARAAGGDGDDAGT